MTTELDIKRRYDRQRLQAIRDGNWGGRVDVEELIAHVATLRSAGMSARSISLAAGVSLETVGALAWPQSHNKPRKWVNSSTAAALMSVISASQVPPWAFVDATGTLRRLQALACMGWPTRDVPSMAGLGSADLLNRTKVRKSTADAISRLYDRRCMSPGPSWRAKLHAKKSGWAPPLAWGEDIDDPDATPNLGDKASPHADIDEWLFLVEGGVDATEAASRVGVQVEAIARTAERNNRDDIARLARPAAVRERALRERAKAS